MRSKTNLIVAPAVLALALFFLPQTGWGEEAVADQATETTGDSEEGDDTADSKKNPV